MDFFVAVGLPLTLKEIGLENVTDEELCKVAEATAVQGETIHGEPFEVTPEKVFAAIKGADALGKAFLEALI